MTAEEMWRAYLLTNPQDSGARYEAWAYGSDDPDSLADLTLVGTKTATASAFALYEAEGDEPPKQGDFSIILRSDEKTAVCVIQTTKVAIVPFSQVTAEQARKEGEGDRSLAFWRRVHQSFFTAELAAIPMEFSEDMMVVCEEFKVVYRPKERG